MSNETLTSLVTGASGQDGMYLCERLLSEGRRVLGVVRPESRAVLVPGVERVTSDLGVAGAMENLVKNYPAGEIYNLAAESFSPACNARPLAAADLLGRVVLELLEAVRCYRPSTRIFQASSSEMFGVPDRVPQDESTPLRPETIYGTAKAFAHRMCGIYRQRHGLFVATGILFAHESPRRRAEFLTKKVCRAVAMIAAGRQSELVLGDLEARRDWSFAGDIANGMRLTLAANEASDYVFASGVLHSVREFCELAFKRAGLDYRTFVRTDPELVRGDSRTIVGDPTHAWKSLGWRASMTFGDLVGFLVDDERNNLDGVSITTQNVSANEGKSDV